MPDQATIRDVAKKLERWAAMLPPEDQATLESWMRLGTDIDDPVGQERWWFEPGFDADRSSLREPRS
jgi:hypothetical protein